MWNGMIRRSLTDLANESVKETLLNKIPAALRERMYAEGGDITVDMDKNSFTISGCPEALTNEIAVFLKH